MRRHELRTCPGCGCLHTVEIRRTNHVLHGVLSLLTLGLWLPVWAVMGLESVAARPQAKCERCAPRKWWEGM